MAFRRYGDATLCQENPTHGEMTGWSSGSEDHPETQGPYCRRCLAVEEMQDRAAEYDRQVTVESVAFVKRLERDTVYPEWTL